MSSKEIQLKVLDITIAILSHYNFSGVFVFIPMVHGWPLFKYLLCYFHKHRFPLLFYYYYYFYVVTVVLYHSLTWAEEPGPQSMVEPLVELLCGRLMDRSRGYRQKDLVEVPLCASPRAWILFLSLLPVFPILPKVAGCGCRVLPAALLVLITTPSRACV